MFARALEFADSCHLLIAVVENQTIIAKFSFEL